MATPKRQNPRRLAKPEAIAPTQPTQYARNFVIPHCVVQIASDESVPIEDLVSVAFGVAADNPDAYVDFWIQIRQS